MLPPPTYPEEPFHGLVVLLLVVVVVAGAVAAAAAAALSSAVGLPGRAPAVVPCTHVRRPAPALGPPDEQPGHRCVPVPAGQPERRTALTVHLIDAPRAAALLRLLQQQANDVGVPVLCGRHECVLAALSRPEPGVRARLAHHELHHLQAPALPAGPVQRIRAPVVQQPHLGSSLQQEAHALWPGAPASLHQGAPAVLVLSVQQPRWVAALLLLLQHQALHRSDIALPSGSDEGPRPRIHEVAGTKPGGRPVMPTGEEQQAVTLMLSQAVPLFRAKRNSDGQAGWSSFDPGTTGARWPVFLQLAPPYQALGKTGKSRFIFAGLRVETMYHAFSSVLLPTSSFPGYAGQVSGRDLGQGGREAGTGR